MIFDYHLTKEEEKEKNLGVGVGVRVGWVRSWVGFILCVEMDLGSSPPLGKALWAAQARSAGVYYYFYIGGVP